MLFSVQYQHVSALGIHISQGTQTGDLYQLEGWHGASTSSILVQAIISSYLDCYITLLTGFPASTFVLKKKKCILHTATRIIINVELDLIDQNKSPMFYCKLQGMVSRPGYL